MDIGIYTEWRRRATTFAAIQLAQFLRYRHDVTLLSASASPAAVHTCFDARICGSRGQAERPRFTDWAKGTRTIIWTHCPHRDQVLWANNHGKFTVLLATCREDDAALREVYPVFHRVVAPGMAMHQLLTTRYRLSNLMEIEWSPMAPVTRKEVPARPVRFYIVATEGVRDGPDLAAIRLAFRLLKGSDACVTIAYDGWDSVPLRLLGRLIARFARDPRLTVAQVGDYDTHLRRMLDHDLVVLPSRLEPFGLSGLMALHMGTPILAWDVPPFGDFATHGGNAFLLPAEAGDAWTDFEATAMTVAQDPPLLDPVRARTHVGLAARRFAFERLWTEILKVADG